MKLRSWIILAALAVISACSGIRQRESDKQTLERYMDYAGEPVEQFSSLGRFDGWHALGRDKLVVWTSPNNAYLLTVQTPCPDLQFATSIGLTSTAGTVHRGFDSVKLGRHEQCRITEIRPVNYKELKEAKRAGG